ncbi:hypothetical protein JXA80_10860 [bacterium]|nr:hypothetical protein [candidate division CSSED10-310 bacterium]
MVSPSNSGRDYSRVIRFCMDFQGLLKAVEMYTTEHLAAVDAAVRCLNSFRPLVFEDQTITITPGNSSLQIGPTFIPEKILERTPAFQRVAKLLDDRRITMIAIRPDVAADDFLAMAHTLTSPFEPTVAERQYDELETKTRYRITISGKETERTESVQHLLPHVIAGSLDVELTSASRELLYLEITRNIEETGRVLQKQMKKEVSPESPTCPRDVLNEYCNRWVHLLGELLEMIHSGQDTASAERQRQVLEMMLPYLETIPNDQRCPEFNALMDKMHGGDLSTKIRLFAEYYDGVFQRVADFTTFRHRVDSLILAIESLNDAAPDETVIQSIRHQLDAIIPGTTHFTILYDKLIHRVYQSHHPELVHNILTKTFGAYLTQESLDEAAVQILGEKTQSFCHEFKSYCENTLTYFIRTISEVKEPAPNPKLIAIPLNTLAMECESCERIKECGVFDLISRLIPEPRIPRILRLPLIEHWQRMAHALLECDINVFRTRIPPLAESVLAPDAFDENDIQDVIADAWKSFADTTYFQSVFKRLTDPDRETRFSTINHLANYGKFAVWLSLGGLNNDNWQLRRNLATIIGRVASLDEPVFLKLVLRDRDWHVRFEVISALRRRVEEVTGQIRKQANHPLGRLITLALLDGRQEIRMEAYSIIENIAPPEAVRSLISTYQRLSAVSDDYEIQERSRILAIMSMLGRNNSEAAKDVVHFAGEIASMKEGILTPQWMIPLKKAAVECLVMIDTPDSRAWLETLAHKRPYKRGVVGREARSVLKRLQKES